MQGVRGCPGVIPTAVSTLFHLAHTSPGVEALQVRVSMLEVYNERVTDLLAGVCEADLETDEEAFRRHDYDFTTGLGLDGSDANTPPLKEAALTIREGRDGCGIVGLTKLLAATPTAVHDAIRRGAGVQPQRVVAPTFAHRVHVLDMCVSVCVAVSVAVCVAVPLCCVWLCLCLCLCGCARLDSTARCGLAQHQRPVVPIPHGGAPGVQRHCEQWAPHWHPQPGGPCGNALPGVGTQGLARERELTLHVCGWCCVTVT